MSDNAAPSAVQTPISVPRAEHWHPSPKHPLAIVVLVLAVVAAVLVVLAAWGLPPFQGSTEKTENAYVRGRTVMIGSQVSGSVVAVLVKDYEQVHSGQILARVDDRIYRARVEQARANVGAAQANLANSTQARASGDAEVKSEVASLGSARAQLLKARADMARANELVGDGSVSVRERDQTLAALRQAEAQVHQAEASEEVSRQNVRTVDVARPGLEAQVDAARAQLSAAQVDLEHTVIRAAEDGQLGEVGVRLGQFVTNGTQLTALVPEDRWVIADYKEAQTAHMTIGQSATFTVDALGGARLNGHVERLSPAAESEFAVLKPDNATGNFVKVPQRIGVRIAIDPGQALAARLRPGMSVEARVETRGGP
jgi:multidrug resistance efflux pump